MNTSNATKRAATGWRTPKSLLALAICALSVLLTAAQRVDGCSCRSQPSVLDAYQHADLVVIARAVSVEKTNAPHAVDGIESTTLIIEKLFKGELKVGEKLVFGQGGGADCIWTFDENDVGKDFLFYLKAIGEARIWLAGTCGRSRYLETRRMISFI